MAQSTQQKLLSLLRAEGPLSPASIMARLGLSQPTLFRAAKAQSENIATLGAPRNRKLAALRSVRGLGASIPVFKILNDGEVVPVGQLLALYPHSFVLVTEATPSKPQFYPGLPFFLDDMRPQGFLGKSFNKKHSDLRLPPRISDWNNDDILEAIARRGEDLVGNLLVGAESFERYQALQNSEVEVIKVAQLEQQYVIRAQAAIDGETSGSSVGGEHPKFSTTVLDPEGDLQRVLVKFSPAGATFSAERWRDLLICESIALDILRDHGIAAARGRVIEVGGRTFLETIRYDRIGAYGRKGVLSLAALENEWTGHSENWAVSGHLLARDKKISPEDLIVIQKLECFGRLIANSDRHPGNLSFFWQPGDTHATLAPVYDMLPMLYAPSSGGEDTGRIFELPTYDHTLLRVWQSMLSLAIRYWETVRADPRLSAGFRNIAERNVRVISSPR